MNYKNLNINVVPIEDYQIRKTRFLTTEDDFNRYCEYLNPPVNFFDEIHIENDVAAINKPNIFIQFMNWALRQEDEIVITVYSRNFWVCHDISHAIYNSSPVRIYTVNAQMENQANQFAINLLKELGIENDFIGEELEQYRKQFKKRYKTNCIL